MNFLNFFLTSFGVQAVQMEEKVRKGAYAHFRNIWEFLSQ